MVEFRGEATIERDKAIRFAGSVLGAQRHVCAFFHSPDEEYRVLLPFIKEGFERGEKAFHIVDPELREQHVRRLESAGIDRTLGVCRGRAQFGEETSRHGRVASHRRPSTA